MANTLVAIQEPTSCPKRQKSSRHKKNKKSLIDEMSLTLIWLVMTHQGRKGQKITLNVLSTGRVGFRGEWSILTTNAPVTNNSKAWSGYSCNTNKALDLKLCAGIPQLIIGVPLERIVGSECSGQAGWSSQQPSLPEIQSRDGMKNYSKSETQKL